MSTYRAQVTLGLVVKGEDHTYEDLIAALEVLNGLDLFDSISIESGTVEVDDWEPLP